MSAKDYVTRPQLSTPANDQHCKKLWIHGQIFLHQTTNISKCVLSSKISSLMPWFSKNLGVFWPQRYGMAKCLHIPTSWSDVWKSVEAICLFFAPVFSQISCCSTMTNSGYKRDCIRNRSKREDKDTPFDIVILGYCDIGIISQVWAALHAVGNRIMWWEGQSTFCDGKVGGCISMALALQSLVDFYSNVIYKGKRGNCHVQLFNSWVSWLAV